MIIQRYAFTSIMALLWITGCGGDDSTDTSNTDKTSGTTYTGDPVDSVSAVTCNNHLLPGNAGNSDQILCREGYAVGYNYTTKVANWAQYHITSASVSSRVNRVDNFREDIEIPVGQRATLSDYSNSGYDRGHMAPNATMDFNVSSMDESFLLSNIAPQLASFNRFGWADLEEYVRDCAVTKGELYVVTGPVFNSTQHSTIGSGVAVPDSYYKIVVKMTSPATAFALNVPHAAVSNTDLEDYVTSIDAIEAITGLDFFSGIRDEIENSIESNTVPVCSLPWSPPANTGGGNNSGGNQYGACGTKTRCSQMTTCSEAYYFLNTCGRSSLDGDNDGVPCESICR